MALNSENLTYWYFRLNGFFTIPNFVVHPDEGNEPRTEIDVLGVRLPHRAELLLDPMDDDQLFTAIGNKIFITIAEVKSDLIRFNPTWRDSAKANVQCFLRAAGAFPSHEVDAVADSIYRTGAFIANPQYHVALIGIGRRESPFLHQHYPSALQITWNHISTFIYARFTRYREQKEAHHQWDEAGRELWDLWEGAANEPAFQATIGALA